MNNNQTSQTSRQPPLPPGQRQLQPTQPDYTAFLAVAHHMHHPSHQSHLQVPPSPAYDPQRTVPQLSRPPPPDQSAFYTNYDYDSQGHRQQHRYEQHHFHLPPPVAQSPPQPAALQNYNSDQPTAGYPRHHVPHPAAYPQPRGQPQQQKRSRHTLSQTALPAKRQRFGSPDLNRLAQDHAHLLPQSQFQSLASPAQNTGVYPVQSQESGHGDGDGWNNMQPGLGGNFGGAASIQADRRDTIYTSVAAQLQGAQNVNVSGNPTLMNIGTNTGNLTTVNNFGGTIGLENLKEFVSFAALHNSAEQDHRRRCHPGTRENVLMRLRHWADNPNPSDRIFWLHGPAGAGKSAIAQTIAHTYKRENVAATFFFYRSDPNRNDGNRLFTTIAWQLAFSIPAVKDFIVEALNKLPHLPRTDVETQFEELLVNPTTNIASQMLQLAPVIIIDGVDECSDEQLQRRFLTVIGDAVKNDHFPLRFLIVSRSEALIEETLHKFQDFMVPIDLAKLDDSNRDIQKYLEDKFFEIASNRGLDPTWPGQEIIEEIASKSSGNFIFASVVIGFISDEDYGPEFLLNIVRNLTPRGNIISPFALLDELFSEILKRQRDQDFLKTFLALLAARSFICLRGLYNDDAILMNVSEKDLCLRLRKMRSLLKFDPFIHVYHKSFLDFLQDPSRSGQYHVSKEGRVKRLLALIVDSVVRHVSMAIDQPNCHEICHFSPKFKSIVAEYPPKINLSVEYWQESLKPLWGLQDKLLKTPKSQSCRGTQVMRDLLLHLVILQGNSYPITAAQGPEPNMNNTDTEWGPALVTEAQKNIPEKDLDSCFSVLLSCLQKIDSVMVVDRPIFDLMSAVLAFDHAETVAKVQTISDAQKLIDIIDLLINNECFLSRCGPDAARKAALLASEIFSRVPISKLFELACQTAFISRILDHNYIVPVLGICNGSNALRLASGDENEQGESIREWLKISRPNLVTRIKVILEVARTIRYIHSMDVTLVSSCIQAQYFFLNSTLRAKFEFTGLFAWWVREASIYGHEASHLFSGCTYESNISAFARLLFEVCFKGHNEKHSNHLQRSLVKDVKQLYERCCTKDQESRPNMNDVVTEMETWNLT